MKVSGKNAVKNFAKMTMTLFLATTLFALSACGQGSQGTPNIDRIKEAGKLVMLTNASFPPFEYLGDDNEVAGVDADLAEVIADEIGVELEIVNMDFDGIVPAIQAGSGDLGVAGITNDESRREMVDFSVDYVATSQMIIVKEDSGYTSAADLVGKRIGVQMGTTGDIYAGDIEGAEISRLKTGPDAGLALSNGQIDAVVIDEMPAQQIAAANPGLIVLEEPLTDENYAIAIKKGNTDLKEVVDRVLQRMLDDGTLQEIIDKHVATQATE